MPMLGVCQRGPCRGFPSWGPQSLCTPSRWAQFPGSGQVASGQSHKGPAEAAWGERGRPNPGLLPPKG